MALTREQIAERLRELRTQIGYTQSQVADILGVHRPTISEIEAGRRAVTAEELYVLARCYATTVGEILSANLKASTRLQELVSFRADNPLAATCRAAIKQFIADRHSEIELEEMLGMQRPPAFRHAFPMPAPRSSAEASVQGSEVARQERQQLSLGAEPVRNVLQVVAQQGIRVGPIRDIEEGIDGIFFESEDLGSCVGVNWRSSDWTGGRAAFTVAHEYAHALFRDCEVEWFSLAKMDQRDLREVRANAFAAAFLMPEDGLESFFADAGLLARAKTINHLAPGDVVSAMDHFGVSRQALLFRLCSLRWITKDLSDSLQSFVVRTVADACGIRFGERDYSATRLPQLAIHAWRRGFLTSGRAAELCGTSIEDFLENMRALGEMPDSFDGQSLLGASAPTAAAQ